MSKDFDVVARQRMAANARERLLDQQVRHWKGDFYVIRDVSLREKNGDIEILYVSEKYGFRWTRTYAEMFDSIDVGGTLQPRFALTNRKMPAEER